MTTVNESDRRRESQAWLYRFAQHSWLALSGALWLVAVAGGMTFMVRYENAPGQPANAPATWPDPSRIERSSSRATLVVLAHPQCPCTRATMGELELIMMRCRQYLRAYVLFLEPHGFDRSWVRSDLWRQAEAIPGVSVIADKDGREARRFKARTSGQALLYDRTGRLRFRGGITPSRGHSGDNAGRSAIVALASDPGKAYRTRAECFVFGCPLFTESSSD